MKFAPLAVLALLAAASGPAMQFVPVHSRRTGRNHERVARGTTKVMALARAKMPAPRSVDGVRDDKAAKLRNAAKAVRRAGRLR